MKGDPSNHTQINNHSQRQKRRGAGQEKNWVTDIAATIILRAVAQNRSLIVFPLYASIVWALNSSFGYSAFCSSKFALVGLSDTLRTELKPQNIKVNLVCPGEFDSPMVDELNTYRTTENRVLTHTVPVLSIDVVADEIIKGFLKDRYLIIPGKLPRLVELFSRGFPAISRKMSD